MHSCMVLACILYSVVSVVRIFMGSGLMVVCVDLHQCMLPFAKLPVTHDFIP